MKIRKGVALALCLCATALVVVGRSSPSSSASFRTYTAAKTQETAALVSLGRIHGHLDNLLVERVPGTPTHAAARSYIVTTLERLGWTVELDTFEESTPYGMKTFSNIIATIDSTAPRRVILAAHYDSKYFEKFSFVGATDSGASIAMMLEVATLLSPTLTARAGKGKPSLQLIFFDGEEAWKDWTATDSIYGSRHLAAKWDNTPGVDPSKTSIQEIEALMLLDLLGARSPHLRNMHPSTSALFERLHRVEERLNRLDLLPSTKAGSARTASQPMFDVRSSGAAVEDDHIPFLRRGVPILHLISMPFPSVWHTAQDDRSALDDETMVDLTRIFTIFFAEYFHIASI